MKIKAIDNICIEEVKEIARKLINESYSVKSVIEMTGLSPKDAEEVLERVCKENLNKKIK